MAASREGSRHSSKDKTRSSKYSSKGSTESHRKHRSKPRRSVSESGDDTSNSTSGSEYPSNTKRRASSKHHTKLKESAETHRKRKNEHLVSENDNDTSDSSSERKSSSTSKSKKHSSKRHSTSNESSSKHEKHKSRSKRSASQSNVESSDSSSEHKKRSKKHSSRHQSEIRNSSSAKASSKHRSRRSHSESRQNLIEVPSNTVPLERRCGGIKINHGRHEMFQLVPRDFRKRKLKVKEVKPSDSSILILSPKNNCSRISALIDDVSSSGSSSKITVISKKFDETLLEAESSATMVESYNTRALENISRVWRKLTLKPRNGHLDTIDSGICSTIDEVDSSQSKIMLKSEDLPSIKYLLKGNPEASIKNPNGSRPSSRPSTPRTKHHHESRQMKLLNPEEVEMTTETLMLSPYSSPRTSKTASPRSTRAASPERCASPQVVRTDTLPVMGSEDLTKFVAYLDMLDVRLKPEKVERETQEPDGIPLTHSNNRRGQSFQPHPDLPIDGAHEDIQEFFANLPLPPLPNDSLSRPDERVPLENVRQRWRREFGRESDENDDSDNDVEEEDLEVILDLCNDRFLKQRRSRK
ncbi:hypothetical protein Trydic_g14621 [Trypoxylus dichotomus]